MLTQRLTFGRLLIVFVFISTFSLNLSAQTLVLWHADGSSTDVELFTQPHIQFTTDKVLITSTVLYMEYAREDVLRFTYKGRGTGLDRLQTESSFTQENGYLVFHGIKPSDKVEVCTSSGLPVPVRLIRSGTDVRLSLSLISSGTYLLRVNGRTSKFTRP